MATGKKNYFRHSFNARNDEFIIGLINEFGERGYYMWFALCEMCGELLADGHQFPLKFHQSRLYKELRCTQRTLNLFLTYSQHRSKVLSTYVEPTFNLEIPNLIKFIGKYSENGPNKRKEKENKEKENKVLVEASKKVSPLSFLFANSPEIQQWLNEGIHETHMMLLKKHSHHVLVDLIEQAYAWAVPRNKRAETWLYTFTSNKNTHGYGANQPQKRKSTATPDNPTGNPYKEQLKQFDDKNVVNA